jgi:diguanylate cyclase
MAINLSIKQLRSPNFVRQVEGVLKKTGLDPRYLELEITEGYAIKDSEDISRTLKNLKAMGILIAIDDFGIAYSPLTYLKVIPADIIKIDQTFIQGIKNSRTDEAITKSIISLAKNMDLHVIAEGVETMHQRDFLAQEMCDEQQGFYFSKPMPLDTLEKMWQEKIKAS